MMTNRAALFADSEAALRAAELAVKMTGGLNVRYLSTLARAAFITGDIPHAVKMQCKVLALEAGAHPGHHVS